MRKDKTKIVCRTGYFCLKFGVFGTRIAGFVERLWHVTGEVIYQLSDLATRNLGAGKHPYGITKR